MIIIRKLTYSKISERTSAHCDLSGICLNEIDKNRKRAAVVQRVFTTSCDALYANCKMPSCCESAGVAASTRHNPTSDHSPEDNVRYWAGLAPSPSVNARKHHQPKGTRPRATATACDMSVMGCPATRMSRHKS